MGEEAGQCGAGGQVARRSEASIAGWLGPRKPLVGAREPVGVVIHVLLLSLGQDGR